MRKFQSYTSVHNFLFNIIPILSKWNLTGLSHFKCLMRFWSLNYLKLIWMTFELFRLEVMLSGWILDSILLERSRIEVRHVSILLVFSIKFNRLLVVLLHNVLKILIKDLLTNYIYYIILLKYDHKFIVW